MNQPSSNTLEMSMLSAEHAARLAASAISKEVAAERGYKTLTRKSELKEIGFGAAQQLVPTLLLPVWGIGGDVVLYHHRPDQPRMRDGKLAKYEFPGGSHMALDVHPCIREKVRRPDVPLFITEGIRKADAAISAGLCCLAVIGTWNWRGTNEHSGKTALPDWDSIALKDKHNAPRQVYIAYDSDVMLKPSVHLALARLSDFLKSRGAKVAYVYLPHGEDGQKVGLDDYLAAGHTTDDLLALATPILRPAAPGSPAANHPYTETPTGLVRTRQTPDGPQDTPLTNFTARITADIVEDDGAETRRTFEIDACRNGRTSRVTVPASTFALMNWPMETLGAGALLYPGLGAKDHTRAAIQLLSGDPPLRYVYAHTGWRQLNQEDADSTEDASEHWAYLHAAGATGSDSPVHVRLPDALARYALPPAPTGDALIRAVRASLRLLDLLPDALAFPLLAAPYRAVLGTCDFSLHLAGPSGAFKSELAALAQQHFGPGLDARHLPASWTATDNALEGLAFAVKDALMVVDDFAPSGSGLDVQRLHAKADRLLRGQGNNSGRLRMRADATLKAAKYPRGLILSTGEDLPAGLSLQARLLVLEIAPGHIAPAALTLCQQDARTGLYAQSLAGFLAWLAPTYGTLRAGLTAEKDALRDAAGLTNSAAKSHRRTPETAAHLGLGLRRFLHFCLDAGAITPVEQTALWTRGWNALRQTAAAQSAHQSGSEPARRFLELLTAVLASGKGHLASPTGDAPDTPAAWGWRKVTVGSGDHERLEWRPTGDRLGWLDTGEIFLQPAAAFTATRKLGEGTSDGLLLTLRTLTKRLSERGLLTSTDKERGTLTVRRTFSGQRHHVLHLHPAALHDQVQPPNTAQSAQSDLLTAPDEAGNAFTGQFTGQFAKGPSPKPAPEIAQPNPAIQSKHGSQPGGTGQNGQFGQFSEDAERETWRP